jgi:hypothetical protein
MFRMTRLRVRTLVALITLAGSGSGLAQGTQSADEAGSDSRRFNAIADTILQKDVSWTPSFTPSIRLKSFDLNLQDFVAKRAPSEFSPGPPTTPACGMQRFQMKLSNAKGDVVNEFAVLLDPQSPGQVKPGYLLARTEVLHVDSDGSPRSYHPDDPLGNRSCKLSAGPSGGFVADRACAMDTFHDARVLLFEGTREIAGPELQSTWPKIWPGIRDGTVKRIDPQRIPDSIKENYYGFEDGAADLRAFFKRDIVVPSANGPPCLRSGDSRFPGYFVAATALSHKVDVPGADIADPDRIAPKECTPLRWIDAATVPFFVLPGSPFGDIHLGGLAVIYAIINGEERIVYAVIGDSGPTESFGEASVALIQLLQKKSLQPVENNAALNSWDIDGKIVITVLLLGKTDAMIGPQYTRQAIEAAGRNALAKWNDKNGTGDILQRLRMCSSQAPPNKSNK